MSTIVDVPGMGQVEFPDGMSDDDISAAIRKNMPAAAPKPRSLLQEMGRGVGLIGRAGIDVATGVPGLFANAASQAINFAKNPHVPSLNELNPFAGNGGKELPTEALNARLDRFMPKAEGVAENLTRLVPSIMLGAKVPLPGVNPTALPAKVPPPSVADDIVEQATSVSVNPTARATGGGAGFGAAGPDPSAGLTAAQNAALAGGRKLGMRATPGQVSGSRVLQQMEAKLESQPMTSGPFNALKENNNRVLAQASAKGIGIKAKEVNSQVLDKAWDNIGKVYDDVADDVARNVDPDNFVDELASIEDEATGLLANNASIVDHPLVRQFYDLVGRGKPTGAQMQNMASKLGKAAYNNATSANGDRELAIALSKVKDLADDALEEGLSGDRLKAFQRARGNYRNLMLLTQRGNVVNPNTGNVNGISLASLLQQKDKAGFLRGKNKSDMYQAARFAQAFKPLVGDSGTATRSMVTNPTDFLLSLPTNVATRMYLSRPSQFAAQQAMSGKQALMDMPEELLRNPQPLLGAFGGAYPALLGPQ